MIFFENIYMNNLHFFPKNWNTQRTIIWKIWRTWWWKNHWYFRYWNSLLCSFQWRWSFCLWTKVGKVVHLEKSFSTNMIKFCHVETPENFSMFFLRGPLCLSEDVGSTNKFTKVASLEPHWLRILALEKRRWKSFVM